MWAAVYFYKLCKSYDIDTMNIVLAYPGKQFENDFFVTNVVETKFGTKLKVLHEKFLHEQVHYTKKKLMIKYELLHPEVLPPTQAHANDAGWDVSSIEDVYTDKKLGCVLIFHPNIRFKCTAFRPQPGV